MVSEIFLRYGSSDAVDCGGALSTVESVDVIPRTQGDLVVPCATFCADKGLAVISLCLLFLKLHPWGRDFAEHVFIRFDIVFQQLS